MGAWGQRVGCGPVTDVPFQQKRIAVALTSPHDGLAVCRPCFLYRDSTPGRSSRGIYLHTFWVGCLSSLEGRQALIQEPSRNTAQRGVRSYSCTITGWNLLLTTVEGHHGVNRSAGRPIALFPLRACALNGNLCWAKQRGQVSRTLHLRRRAS